MGTCCKIFSKVLSFYAEIQFIRSILLYESISGQDFGAGLVSSQTAHALDQILPGVNQHTFVHFNIGPLRQFFVFSVAGLELRFVPTCRIHVFRANGI